MARERGYARERRGVVGLIAALFAGGAACAVSPAIGPDLSDSKRLTLWATYYSIPRVRSLESGGHALLDPSGQKLGPMLSTRDFCDAGMEGTVQVRWQNRWRTYNYVGTGPSVQVDCSARYPRHAATGRSRFRESKKPYGEGASGARLVPFRSIAVDPRFIPYRTVLFVPLARGVVIAGPDGENFTHDGYFFAADTGGSIRGSHVDVFIGARGPNPFAFVGSRKEKTFEAYVVDDVSMREVLARAHDL